MYNEYAVSLYMYIYICAGHDLLLYIHCTCVHALEVSIMWQEILCGNINMYRL